jgi:sodium pump decarboxylase gamma subunit
MDHWQITALGMGTVFLALIALSLIVSLFPLLFRKPDKKRAEPAPLPQLSEQHAAPQAVAGAELVAVIAAAVAAQSGAAPGQFRISSIVPAGAAGTGEFNTPVWGHVDRLGRSMSTH